MTTSESLTLYGETLWISPYVFSSFVALREKRLPFEIVEVALVNGAQHDPAYRERTLTAKVPALAHGSFSVAESSAIAEYLDDVFPTPLVLPADLRQRARARQIMAWLRSDLMALREERPTTTMFYQRASAPLSAAGADAAATLVRVAEQLIAPGETSLFGAWCLADSELAFMLHRLILNAHTVPRHVRNFAEAQWMRPSVEEFVTHARPAVIPPSYWTMTGTPQPATYQR